MPWFLFVHFVLFHYILRGVIVIIIFFTNSQFHDSQGRATCAVVKPWLAHEYEKYDKLSIDSKAR